VKVALALLVLLVGLSSSFALEGAGTGTCARYTPPGIPCYCNAKVRSGRHYPGWNIDPTVPHMYIRPGWRTSAVKGMHGAGRFCYRD
jgi:hypothetical protein